MSLSNGRALSRKALSCLGVLFALSVTGFARTEGDFETLLRNTVAPESRATMTPLRTFPTATSPSATAAKTPVTPDKTQKTTRQGTVRTEPVALKTASKPEPTVKNEPSRPTSTAASSGWVAVVPNEESAPVESGGAAENATKNPVTNPGTPPETLLFGVVNSGSPEDAETSEEGPRQGFSLFERSGSDNDDTTWFGGTPLSMVVTPAPEEPRDAIPTADPSPEEPAATPPEMGRWVSSETGKPIAANLNADDDDGEKNDGENEKTGSEKPRPVTADEEKTETLKEDAENAKETNGPEDQPVEQKNATENITEKIVPETAPADETPAGQTPEKTKEETKNDADEEMSGEEPAELKPEVFQHVRENTPPTQDKLDALRENLIPGTKKETVDEKDGAEETGKEAPEAVVRNPGVGAGGPVDGSQVGDLHAATKIKLLTDEIRNGLNTRNMSGRLGMWQGYARSTLRSTNSIHTNSEIDARCRLNWYVKLFSDVIGSIGESDKFSRDLHHALIGDHTRFAQALAMIREKLDVPPRNDEGVTFVETETPQCAVDVVARALCEAQVGMSKALSTLTIAEQKELADNLYSTFSGSGCVNGHTIPNRSVGRRLTSIMMKMDRTGVHEAAEAFAPLIDRRLLDKLSALPENAYESTMIGGQKFQRVATPAGDILIGGRENTTYDLDTPEFRDVVCIIDLGGNNTYRDGVCNIHRPVFVILDVGHGQAHFQATKPGVQGGSILGASLLVNAHGKMICQAQDVAQGSTIGGVGILVDFGKDSEFKALRRAQGHALCGVGILLNKGEGNNKYHAALWAQGFGAPGGFGVLEDVAGNDHYYCGGLYIDSYPEHPGYDGWGQGVGAGIRQVANGGIGMILDGGGDDVYEVDYFGHGVGYWLGVGIARDFGGNDRRLGSTQLAYNGQPRREAKWTRFVNGIGCHYSLGFLYDDEGHDFYGGTIMGTGMAWDLSIGVLCDFNGNDTYAATGGMTQGVGAEGSIGILFDYGGDDKYMGRNQAYASGGITYHSPSSCGSNFSFLIDYGGNDSYGCGARNNSYVQRGSSGGYLIDRPLESEAEAQRIADAKAAEERAEKAATEAKAREEAIAVIRELLAEKKPLTQQQRQLWYQHQRQQRQQQIQAQPQRNQGRPASQQQIGSVPSLGKTSGKISNAGGNGVK